MKLIILLYSYWVPRSKHDIKIQLVTVLLMESIAASDCLVGNTCLFN